MSGGEGGEAAARALAPGPMYVTGSQGHRLSDLGPRLGPSLEIGCLERAYRKDRIDRLDLGELGIIG